MPGRLTHLSIDQSIYRLPESRQYENVIAEIFPSGGTRCRVTTADRGILLIFGTNPCNEDAKIPLNRYRFEAFVSNPLERTTTLDQQHVQMLFHIDDHERAESLYALFYAAIMNSPPNHEATKSTFHSFWDYNIRKILEALIPSGISIHDSNQYTSTDANAA